MRILKRVERRSCGCCLFVALGFLLLVAGLTFLIVKAASAEGLPPAYDVVLVSDQSPSMWDCDGIGTDPELLRVDAARLFISYLGVDSSARYRLGLLHFGGQVEQVAPLTDLADAAAREALTAAASAPQAINWTDPLAALDAAGRMVQEAGRPGSRRLIVLLTDGEPAPNPTTGAYDAARYVAALQARAQTFAEMDTALAVVLLSDLRTSCGRRVASTWAERWSEIAERTPGGACYTASQAEDLLPVYYAIVRELVGRAGGSEPVATLTLTEAAPFVLDVPVTEPLASLILTIWKGNPTTRVAVQDPVGRAATADQADVTVIGHTQGAQRDSSVGREEVWRIEQPALGTWQVILTGQGRVRVWQDRLPLPTPTPSPTPRPSATPTASATPPPTSTATARPSATPTALARPRIIRLTPTPTAAPTTGLVSSASPAGRRLLWPLMAGVGVLGLGGVAGGAAVRRRNGPFLSGQLIPLVTPAAAPLLPRDLDSERRRQIVLGRGGHGPWGLPGWPGALRLTAVSRRTVSISPLAGEATVDGQPVQRPTDLQDGAVIGCGEYRIRYENLLN